jgi:hypothetical protein
MKSNEINKGTAGQGRAGQGRAGQGRADKMRNVMVCFVFVCLYDLLEWVIFYVRCLFEFVFLVCEL